MFLIPTCGKNYEHYYIRQVSLFLSCSLLLPGNGLMQKGLV